MYAPIKRRRVTPAIIARSAGQTARVTWANAFVGQRGRRGYRYLRPRVPLASRGFYGPGQRVPQERKVIDVQAATSVCNTTGAVTLINGVATGTDFTQRIGRKIKMVSVQIRGWLVPDDNIVNPNMARIMVVYDSQPNGALAAVTDILLQADATSMMNLNNRDRFRVLLDEQLASGPRNDTASIAVADNVSLSVNRYVKCNWDVVFDGTAATIGSIQTGALLLVTVGMQAAGNANTLTYSTRVRFIDA